MLGRYPYNPGAFGDGFEDQQAQGPFYKYFLGIALPVGILYYGVAAVVTRHAWMYGQYSTPMELRGMNAVAIGVAAISLGVFLHCHYFWGNIYNQAWFAVLGKIVSASGFIAGLVTLIVRWCFAGNG